MWRGLWTRGVRARRGSGARSRRALGLSRWGGEALEARVLLTVDLTPLEQYFLELVNRARANPTEEAREYGLASLNDGLSPGTISSTPKAPLAANQLLLNAARAHSRDMFDRNYFEHTNPEGLSPGQRIAATGYPFTTWGENIAYYSEGRFRAPTAEELAREQNDADWAERHHEGLFKSPGHRTNLMRDSFREIGIGVIVDSRSTSIESYATQNFGTRSGDPFLLGVAYVDTTKRDEFYTIGEGLGGVTITAVSQTGQTFTTTTGTAGGYVLQLPGGTYTVTASGGALSAPVQRTGVVVSGANVKSDFQLASLAPPPNQPPQTNQPEIGRLTVLQEGVAGLLFPAARFTDADSATTGGGTVVVTIAGAVSSDRLSVANEGTAAGQIGVAGTQVTFGGAALGTVSGGTGTTPLTVTLAADATPAGVQQLLRSIQYRSTATTPPDGARVVTATVTDGVSNSGTVSREVRIAARRDSSPSVRFLRAYNPNADYHFFTTAAPEFNNAVAAGYRDETQGQAGFEVRSDHTTGTSLIHRLYNLTTGRHYYTVSDGERDVLVRIGWRFEKDEGFMATAPSAGLVEVFRLYNKNSGVHLYTESAGAKDAILTAFPGVWEQHSSLGYARAVGEDGLARSVAAAAAGASSPEVDTEPTVNPLFAVSLVALPAGATTEFPATSAPFLEPEERSVVPSDETPDDTGLDAVFAGEDFGAAVSAW